MKRKKYVALFLVIALILSLQATVFAGEMEVGMEPELEAEPVTVQIAEQAAAIPVTGVTLSDTRLTAPSEAIIELVAEVQPQDASNKNVAWTSSDSTVARYHRGLIICDEPGTAVITVTTEDGGFSAECSITVTPADGYGPQGEPNTLLLTSPKEVTFTGLAPGVIQNRIDHYFNPNKDLLFSIQMGDGFKDEADFIANNMSKIIVYYYGGERDGEVAASSADNTLRLHSFDAENNTVTLSISSEIMIATEFYQLRFDKTMYGADPALTIGKDISFTFSFDTKEYEAPDKVTGLNVVEAFTNSIVIEWDAVSMPEGAMELGYDIYINDEMAASSNETQTTLTDLDSATVYNVAVSAHAYYPTESDPFDVNGPLSDEVKMLTCPQDVTGFKVRENNKENIVVTWSRVPRASLYTIYNNGTPLGSTDGTKTSYRLTKLTPGSKLNLSIIASFSAEGQTSESEISATLKAATAPAKVRELSCESFSKNNLTATWSPSSGATHYRIYLDNKKVATVNASRSAYTFTGLKAATRYSVKVAPVLRYGETSYRGTSAGVIIKTGK